MTAPEKSVEEIVNQIIGSEPVQNLLAIEYRALATGREQNYVGQTLKDAITPIITQTLQTERQKREEVVKAERANPIYKRIEQKLAYLYTVKKAKDSSTYDGYTARIAIATLEDVLALTQNNPKL